MYIYTYVHIYMQEIWAEWCWIQNRHETCARNLSLFYTHILACTYICTHTHTCSRCVRIHAGCRFYMRFEPSCLEAIINIKFINIRYTHTHLYIYTYAHNLHARCLCGFKPDSNVTLDSCQILNYITHTNILTDFHYVYTHTHLNLFILHVHTSSHIHIFIRHICMQDICADSCQIQNRYGICARSGRQPTNHRMPKRSSFLSNFIAWSRWWYTNIYANIRANTNANIYARVCACSKLMLHRMPKRRCLYPIS